MVTRVGVLTTRLRLSNSHTLSTSLASVRFLKGPKTTKTGRRQDAALKKTARRGHGLPCRREESGGDRNRTNAVSLGKAGVAISYDAECDALSADRIELLARSVVLVAGMNIPKVAPPRPASRRSSMPRSVDPPDSRSGSGAV